MTKEKQIKRSELCIFDFYKIIINLFEDRKIISFSAKNCLSTSKGFPKPFRLGITEKENQLTEDS